MNFLAPLFLAGAAAIAAPVIFHLIRRSTRQRTLFSSLLFLQASPPRMRRRSRLEDLLLLLLRCIVLLLLAIGFARPFLRNPIAAAAPSAPAQRILLLVDVSASMRRAGLWDAAMARAEKTALELSTDDRLALATFDRESQSLISFDAWTATPSAQRPALVASRLRETGPGWSSTHLGRALVNAAESLVERADDPPSLVRRIVLISDLQEGSQLDTLQSYDWPKGVSLHVERVETASRQGNAGLALLDEPPPSASATNTTVRVRITTTRDATANRLEVGWGTGDGSGFASPASELHLPPGANHSLSLAVPRDSAPDRILLRGDTETFDNTVFLVPSANLATRILFLGDDPGDDPKQPLYFLRRVFPGTNASGFMVTPRKAADAFSDDDSHAALAIATGGLPDKQAGSLHEFVDSGGTALFAPRTADTAASATLGQLLGRAPMVMEEIPARSYAMLGELDFGHPLLSAFANPRYSDFTKLHFWRYRRFDTNALAAANVRVVARFDSGDPAWLEFPVGRGRVFVFTSGWHPDDSQLALSTKFVPLLFGLLEAGGQVTGQRPHAYTIGDSVPLIPPAASGTSIHPPDGSTVTLSTGATNFTRTTLPGIYSIITASSGTSRFAVNIAPSESRTVPLPLEELERLGVPLRQQNPELKPSAERLDELAATEVESRQKLWRWCIAASLVALFLESALAGWTTRRVAPAPDTTTATA